jgi:hypothetical protein
MATVLARPQSVAAAVSLAYAEGGATMMLSYGFLIVTIMPEHSHPSRLALSLALAQLIAPIVLIAGGVRLKHGGGRVLYLIGMALLLAVCAMYLIPPVVGALGVAGGVAPIFLLTAVGVAVWSVIGLILVLRSSTTRYLRLRRGVRSPRS